MEPAATPCGGRRRRPLSCPRAASTRSPTFDAGLAMATGSIFAAFSDFRRSRRRARPCDAARRPTRVIARQRQRMTLDDVARPSSMPTTFSSRPSLAADAEPGADRLSLSDMMRRRGKSRSAPSSARCRRPTPTPARPSPTRCSTMPAAASRSTATGSSSPANSTTIRRPRTIPCG